MKNFFYNNKEQDAHYACLVEGRLPTRHLFSCGYYERFDPFLLDRKPFLIPVYEKMFAGFFDNASYADVLDIGCGTGMYWPVLLKHCGRIVGVDYSAAMISEARRLIETKRLANVEAVAQNVEDLNLPSESFDAVLCIDALHHIPRLKCALANFHRVLRPGGKLFAAEPNMLNPLMFFAHLIPKEERMAIVRCYGFFLRKLFEPYFTDIKICYVNYITSSSSEKQIRTVGMADKMMSAVPFFKPMSFRQLFVMEKRY